jgi:uncharacterized membrane protein YbaN (DUF454 family)
MTDKDYDESSRHLAWIPVMKKGCDDATIHRWLEIAGSETDPARRGDYALAELFAGVVGRQDDWRKADLLRRSKPMIHTSRLHPGPAASAQAPRVVHSSPGRLRVHLPDPSGQVCARLRLLPGVTSAEASEWTGNLLILFDRRQTSEKVLLAELQAPCVSVSVAPVPVTVEKDGQPETDAPAGYVTGVRKRVYRILGWSSVGMAVVGAITPGIPTAPFAILAGYFFVRSSPAAHAWLLRSRWFGQFVRDWEERHAVKRSVKYTAVGLMGAGLGISVLIGLPPIVLGSIVTLEVIGLIVVARLPVVESSLPSPAAAHS